MRNPYPLVQRMCNEIGGSGSHQVLNEYDYTWLYPAFVLFVCVMMTKCLVSFPGLPSWLQFLIACSVQRTEKAWEISLCVWTPSSLSNVPVFTPWTWYYNSRFFVGHSCVYQSLRHMLLCSWHPPSPPIPSPLHPPIFVYCKRSKTGRWWRPGNEARSWLWNLGMRFQLHSCTYM